MSAPESKTKKWLGRIRGKIKTSGSRGSVALEQERSTGTSPVRKPEPPPNGPVPASNLVHAEATRFLSPPSASPTQMQSRDAGHSVQIQPTSRPTVPRAPAPNPSFRQSLQAQSTQSQPPASPALQDTQATSPKSKQSLLSQAAPSIVPQKHTPHDQPPSQPHLLSQRPAYERRSGFAKLPPLAQSELVQILRPPPSATFPSEIQPKSFPPESSLTLLPPQQQNTKPERVTEPLSEYDLEALLRKHKFLDRYKGTPRTCDSALCKAAAAGEELLVQDLLDAGVPIISGSLRTAIQVSRPDTVVPPTSSALHIAIREEQVRVARRLLNHWWLTVCVPSGEGIVAGLASKAQVDKMAELLNQFDDDSRTPLNIAAEVGCAELVSDLLDRGAAIDIPDYLGRTPLHQAARCGKLGVVKILVDRGAAISRKDNQGRSVSDQAVSNGHFDIVRFLEQAMRVKILKMQKERERRPQEKGGWKAQEERERVERMDKERREPEHMIQNVKDLEDKELLQGIRQQAPTRGDLFAGLQGIKNMGLDDLHGLPTAADESQQWEVFKKEFARFRANATQARKGDQIPAAGIPAAVASTTQHLSVEVQVKKSDVSDTKATDGWDDGFAVISYRAMPKQNANTARKNKTEDTDTSAALDWDEPFYAVGYKATADNGVSKSIVGGNDLVQIMREQHVSASIAAAVTNEADGSSWWDDDPFPLFSYRVLKPTTTSTETKPIRPGADGDDPAVTGTPGSAPPGPVNMPPVAMAAAPTRRITPRPLESWLDTNAFATTTSPSTSTAVRFPVPAVSARGQLPADPTPITSPASSTAMHRPPRVSLNERPYIPPSRYRSELERRIEEKRLQQFQRVGLTESEIMRWD